MGVVIKFPRRRRHARTSTGSRDGRGTSDGQAASDGQLSENHRMVRSSRRTCMSLPLSSSTSRLESSSARELTAGNPIPSMSAYARATLNSCSMALIPETSVISPRLSRVFLPRAPDIGFGYFTDMDRELIIKRLDARLKELDNRSDSEASRLSGHRDVIKNMRSKVRHGTGSWPKTPTLIDLARKGLEMDPIALLGPEVVPGLPGAPPSDEPALDRLRAQRDWHLREAEHLETAITFLERDKAG